MVHFLRDKNNNTIIETMCWVKTEDGHSFVEVSSSVDIIWYSSLLLSIENEENQLVLMSMINRLDDLRGWLWEQYFMTKKNDGSDLDDVQERLREFYTSAAEILSLTYVTD